MNRLLTLQKGISLLYFLALFPFFCLNAQQIEALIQDPDTVYILIEAESFTSYIPPASSTDPGWEVDTEGGETVLRGINGDPDGPIEGPAAKALYNLVFGEGGTYRMYLRIRNIDQSGDTPSFASSRFINSPYGNQEDSNYEPDSLGMSFQWMNSGFSYTVTADMVQTVALIPLGADSIEIDKILLHLTPDLKSDSIETSVSDSTFINSETEGVPVGDRTLAFANAEVGDNNVAIDSSNNVVELNAQDSSGNYFPYDGNSVLLLNPGGMGNSSFVEFGPFEIGCLTQNLVSTRFCFRYFTPDINPFETGDSIEVIARNAAGDSTVVLGHLGLGGTGQTYKQECLILEKGELMNQDIFVSVKFIDNGPVSNPLLLDDIQLQVEEDGDIMTPQTPDFSVTIKPESELPFVCVSSQIGTDWERKWTFGDGASSTQLSPEHIYQTAGTYDLCLSVSRRINEVFCIEDSVRAITCREITITPEQIVTFPVDLTEFTGRATNRGVELYWATATELNNDFFALEYRSGASEQFEEIGQVQGKGTTNSPKSYRYLHTRPAQGLNYYRLRQVDFDGSTAYSPLISVYFDRKEVQSVSLFPNPVDDLLQIRIVGTTSNLIGRVINTQGSVVRQQSLEEQGALPLGDLPAGLYYIQLFDDRGGQWGPFPIVRQ